VPAMAGLVVNHDLATLLRKDAEDDATIVLPAWSSRFLACTV
jgi:hypothetical protein